MENYKSKTIRVSEETLKMLANNREGFETPDQCINRLLSVHPQVQIKDVPEIKDKKEPKITVTDL